VIVECRFQGANQQGVWERCCSESIGRAIGGLAWVRCSESTGRADKVHSTGEIVWKGRATTLRRE
jgi:hypothetical protein